MRSLLALILLAPIARTDGASCRVDMRTTDWAEVRTMRAADDPAPITGLQVDYCFAFDCTVQLENLWLFGPTRWSVRDLGLIVEASFDPGFAPGFEVIPSTTIMLNDVSGSVGPFDGVIDYGGTSGESIAQTNLVLLTATLSVSDDSFFRQPWPIYLRTRTLNYTQASASPAMVFGSIASAGGGVAVTYIH